CARRPPRPPGSSVSTAHARPRSLQVFQTDQRFGADGPRGRAADDPLERLRREPEAELAAAKNRDVLARQPLARTDVAHREDAAPGEGAQLFLLRERLLAAMTQRLLGLSHAPDERPELARLDGERVVRAGQTVRQREVLLDQTRAERDRDDGRDDRIARVVGEP